MKRNKPQFQFEILDILRLLCVVLAIAFLSSGCGGGGQGHLRTAAPFPEGAGLPSGREPIESVPLQPPPGVPSNLESVTETIEPPEPEKKLDYGWILASQDRSSTLALLSQAKGYGVKQAQIGGGIYNSIDDLIFDSGKKDFVRAIAMQLKANGIESYLWSRELTLDGPSFRFAETDPMLAARQAAYRMALSLLPEIDGVVLTFEGAKLPPWEAAIPEGQTPLSSVEKIGFVVNAVKKVVVDELGKRLIVRTAAPTPEAEGWIAEALRNFSQNELTVIASISQAEGIGIQIGRRVWVETDLAGTSFGADSTNVSRLGEWLEKGIIAGVAAKVQADQGTGAPNDLDLYTLSRFLFDPSASMEPIWQEWIQNRYGWLPSSWEGITMLGLLRSSRDWERKAPLVKDHYNFALNGDIPPQRKSKDDPFHIAFGQDSRYEWIDKELQSPERQTLLDLSQEALEICEGLDRTLQDLDQLKPRLLSQDYGDLRSQIEHQRRIAGMYYYAKQCLWGFLLWKRAWDEPEALCLEANLERLEGLADEMERDYGPNASSGNPARIRSFAADIRQDFPRVILGARERVWNRLHDISIKQTGPESVEIVWRSDRPSLSRIFATQELPIFGLTLPASTLPDVNHRCVLNGFQPGVLYYFKAQCVTENGEVTNSGTYAFQLVESSV
ncbi:MAG: hypothetical protein AB1656_04350 [Candidatus Omnitrophota bacterium]